jgi:hypothetical protein
MTIKRLLPFLKKHCELPRVDLREGRFKGLTAAIDTYITIIPLIKNKCDDEE